MDTNDYDLLVLGAGSGGLATAKRAASYGAKVAIIESGRVGGTCVIRGCIPKKLMVYAAKLGHALEDAAGYGWEVSPAAFDWPSLVRDRDRAVANLERTHERLLGEAGVELVRGTSRLNGSQEVDVDGRRLVGRYILVATGAEPVFPDVEGIEEAISSDGFFELSERPDHVVIVGSGYIGCEFAGIISALGCKVSLLLRRELPLTGFDIDVRRELLAAMIDSGIDVHTETAVKKIARKKGRLVLDLRGPGGDEILEGGQTLIYSTGRKPNTAGLDLPAVGVELGRAGAVVCDEDGNTAVPSILAVGDATGRAMLTPVAIQAGRAIADRVFGGKAATMSYENIPSAVFTEPPIGTVGLTEEAAIERYGSDGIKVYKSAFTPLIHMLTERRLRTLVKLVVKADDEKVLGCHMIGHDAPEIIQGFAVAVKMGATKADFDATVGIHPSAAEELVTL